MKVKDVVSKIIDNYLKISIDVIKTNSIDRTYVIRSHMSDCSHIPEEIWDKEVDMMVVYYNRLSICVRE